MYISKLDQFEGGTMETHRMEVGVGVVSVHSWRLG
jgi:hypothetical protein